MRKLTNQEFLERTKAVHGNRYDLSKIYYQRYDKTVEVVCRLHGSFHPRADRFLKGSGCRFCVAKRIGRENRLLAKNTFLVKALEIHGNHYCYSKANYIDAQTKVEIICKEHGVFFQAPHNHLRGQGCKSCQVENQRSNTLEFVQKASVVHGNVYDYSKVNYTTAINSVNIRCRKHGIFKQTPNTHLGGRGCPVCKSSKGETKINLLLRQRRVKFERQFRFDDCRGEVKPLPLPFDFVIFESSEPIMAIEFQGRQHFEPVKEWGGNQNFEIIQKNDEKKRNYCFNNKIHLTEIPYWEIKNINTIILRDLQKISLGL